MTDQEFFSSFREKAEAGLKLWESPSVSVGVVKDGQVVLCEGVGLRAVEQRAHGLAARLRRGRQARRAGIR